MDPLNIPMVVTGLLLTLVVLLLLIRLLFLLIRRRRNRQEPSNRDLLVDVLRDKVRDERETRAELSESRRALVSLNRLYQNVTDRLPLSLLVLDEQAEVTFANPMAVKLLGKDEQQKQALDAIFERIDLQAPLGRAQNAVVPLGGKRRTLEVRFTMLSDVQRLMMIEDKTDVTRLEQALQAQRDLALVGELASGMTHEVKNVLAVIQGHAQMMALNHPGEEHAGIIQIEIERLLAVIRRFMDSSASTPLLLKEIPVERLVRETRETWIQRGFSLTVTAKFSASLCIDRILLGVMLDNLILNGFDAMPDEEVVVTFSLQKDLEQWTVVVQDSGPGFSTQAMQKLFVPFYTSKSKGTGLGMFQCRRIVESMGGHIDITNNPTRVSCCFPLNPPAGERYPAPERRTAAGQDQPET